MIDPREVIDIRDQNVDVEAIMEEIRQGLRVRGEAVSVEPHFPCFAPAGSQATGVGSLDGELDYELREAKALHDDIWVSSQFVAQRRSLLGSALAKLKAELHGLVVFYVNLLAAKQVSFNAHSLRATARLAEVLASRPDADEVGALRAEIHQLRDRVTLLEGQIAKVSNTKRQVDARDEP